MQELIVNLPLEERYHVIVVFMYTYLLVVATLLFLQVGYTGFSIAAAKKTNVLSLVIGPGSGYNLVSVTSLSLHYYIMPFMNYKVETLL